MAKKLYLMSGHTSTGELIDLDRMALNDAGNKNILVLNLLEQDFTKSNGKRKFLENYFYEVGAENIGFIEGETSNSQFKIKFEQAGLVYLPGGNTKNLIHNIRSKGLISYLKSFNGVLSGNSAGTYAMCPDYLRIGRGKPEIIPSLGFVNFWTKAHYEPKFDDDLKQLSIGREIYALENESAIVVDNNLNFIGNIWKFFECEKRKVESSVK